MLFLEVHKIRVLTKENIKCRAGTVFFLLIKFSQKLLHIRSTCNGIVIISHLFLSLDKHDTFSLNVISYSILIYNIYL